MMNVKHIFEGIKNSLFVKEEIEKIAKERHSICLQCPKDSLNVGLGDIGDFYSPMRPDEHCTICACNIHAKVRSLATSCPLNKWEAADITPEQTYEITNILNTPD